jgi:hypothetical protein
LLRVKPFCSSVVASTPATVSSLAAVDAVAGNDIQS